MFKHLFAQPCMTFVEHDWRRPEETAGNKHMVVSCLLLFMNTVAGLVAK
jgi:hypothetical protein